jgi:MFS family permease
LIYLGFALAHTGAQIFVLYTLYGLHYGMTYGTANALVADLVPAQFRGTAYGTYNAIIGILAFPASVIAGVLWQGVGTWAGFGPSAPFLFGSALALLAALLMLVWKPAAPAAG